TTSSIWASAPRTTDRSGPSRSRSREPSPGAPRAPRAATPSDRRLIHQDLRISGPLRGPLPPPIGPGRAVGTPRRPRRRLRTTPGRGHFPDRSQFFGTLYWIRTCILFFGLDRAGRGGGNRLGSGVRPRFGLGEVGAGVLQGFEVADRREH